MPPLGRQVIIKRGNCTTVAHIHTKKELEAAWNDISAQGNRQARLRNNLCVVVPADKKLALKLSALFHRRFAIESCCHWDGKTLSMYCGDAGHDWLSLKNNIINLCIGMGILKEEFPGPLFAEEDLCAV